MEIEIDSATRGILDLKVNALATGLSLPEPLITEEEARDIAVKYIEDTTSGLRAVNIHDVQYTIVERALAYVFKMQRGISVYELSLDASTGKIISIADAE